LRQLATYVASIILAVGGANAAVLYEPTPIGSSARTAHYSTSDSTGFLPFDNFTLSLGESVLRATWRGFWIDFNNQVPVPAPSPNVLTWQLGFYADNAGAPGTQLASSSLLAADVTETFQGTGVFNINGAFNVSFYEYSVDLPTAFVPSAAGQYWFSILSVAGASNPAFALRGATGGDDLSYQQQLGAGMSVVTGNPVARDRAIRLEGEVPEPGTIALAGMALLALPLLRRTRTNS